MKNAIEHLALLLFVAFCAGPSTAAEEDDYRLAGTIDAGASGWLAVLELPEGEQRLLRAGDSIGDAQVLEIGDKWVALRRREQDLTLRLENGESSIYYGDLPPAIINLQASDSLRESLNELGRSAKNEAQLADGIGALLKIPDKGRIASIDNSPVRSANHSLLLLKKTLVADHPVRIAVSGVEGFDAIYLMPEQSVTDTNQANND